MILTCPSCATRYSIDPVTIGPEGRAVKCAKCGHKWREFQPDDMPKPVAAAEPAQPEPQPEEGLSIEQMTAPRKAPAPPQKKGKRSWIGWFLLLLLVMLLVAGAYFARNIVVQLWPGSAPLYQSLRIDVETRNMLGLEIHDLKTRSILQNDVTTLTVSGIIKNVTASPQPLPRIRIALIDGDGQTVYSWTTTVEEPQVMPWGQVEFSSSMNQPPEEAKNVKVDLIDPER
ncbi:MAG: hypothetical protein CMN55_09915 [Sneathiella sp.]|jgi:predicted Zn finger-like uncharacterized protein|uniref:DUF3426 domain-containing protein n=1 Tax=Sneathiella sp. TaxID=1964365 RepID=UPI000C48FF49|nr:DUF3426 domain-containing protein [Sneathiella sp.]MAL79413.1 hypothetical protein [Sneathiella sp.]|tara:strand:+ start:1165 stop:1851 length:687 start_codon:yes stop_codon:yes gene_type:complete